jgi:integrase
MRFATVAEVAAVADAIPPRFRALVLVAAYTGLRWGELAGLRVKRVDLLHRQITVAEQLLEVRGRLAFGPTKTGAGLRTVTLPTVAAEALAQHLSVYAEAGPDGLVFPAARAGRSVAATSLAGSGSQPPEPPGWRGCASTTCGTPRPPWTSWSRPR